MSESARVLFKASESAVRSGGRFVSFDGKDPGILSVSIDSRKVSPGDLFIALKGERVDGHDYISGAFNSGAVAAMVSEDYFSGTAGTDSGDGLNSGCYAVVSDTLSGFQALAASWVSDFPELTKIAVTGSSGKSTTKEMLGAILAGVDRTIINEGNLNSETGLPMSVLGIDSSHRYGVFELGINHPGEMKALASVLNPDYALITNIGTAHIGFLGSEEGIALEKADVFSGFSKDNVGFLPAGDKWLSLLESRNPGMSVLFGLPEVSGIQGVESLGMAGWKILYRGIDILMRLVGKHNLSNAVAAISVAEFLGVTPEKIRSGLEGLRPLKGRSQILVGGCTVIEDSYNANFESMSEMLDFIQDSGWQGRIILVLGSMKELGDSSESIHRAVGYRSAELNPDLIFFYGEEMESAYQAVIERGYSGTALHITEYSELEKKVKESVKDGDLVLLKGSRSMGLERLAGILVPAKEGMYA